MKSTENEYRHIVISKSTTISAKIGLKCYYQVQVMGFYVDIVPYKYQTKSKLSHTYFKSTKLRGIDISNISVSNLKSRIGFEKPISASTKWL